MREKLRETQHERGVRGCSAGIGRCSRSWCSSERRSVASWSHRGDRDGMRRAAIVHFFVETTDYPPGTSKWNKIEHRLFSHITMNWRGRPLVSYQVIVNLIGATTTQAWLRVQADLDTDVYPTKVKVTDKQLVTVDLHPHHFHGEWNYTIKHQNN